MQTKLTNGNLYLNLHSKKEQIKLIDIIMEGLCVKELNHDGRKYLKRLREILKFEIDMLSNPVTSDSQRDSINSSIF